MKVKEIYEFINELAPFCLAESWDNCGLLIGDGECEADAVMPVLDVTKDVLKEADSKGVNLIISHHPVIFDGLKSIHKDSVVYFAIEHNINIISAHTNLDMAEQGVTYTLAQRLGLTDLKVLNVLHNAKTGEFGEGLIGKLCGAVGADELAERVKAALDCKAVKLVSGDDDITTVAVANGAEGGLLQYALAAGADAIVAGETKHNVMIDAKNAGVTLIDAGHFETENIIVEVIEQKLKSKFDGLKVIHSGNNVCPYKIV